MPGQSIIEIQVNFNGLYNVFVDYDTIPATTNFVGMADPPRRSLAH